MRRRAKKDILILFLCSLLFLSHFIPSLFSYFSAASHLASQSQFNTTKFYFESDVSFALRMKLQDRILYGSHLKRAAQNIFNKREGYNESFLDSLPIMREKSRDFRPLTCQNSTTHSSKSKVSVIINYHNELLSLLLRSVYSVLASISPHNLHELILIDDGSDLAAYKVRWS